MYLTCTQATKAMSKKLLASRETRNVNSPWPRVRMTTEVKIVKEKGLELLELALHCAGVIQLRFAPCPQQGCRSRGPKLQCPRHRHPGTLPLDVLRKAIPCQKTQNTQKTHTSEALSKKVRMPEALSLQFCSMHLYDYFGGFVLCVGPRKIKSRNYVHWYHNRSYRVIPKCVKV